MRYLAVKCKCSYDKCPDWHVSPIANVQGVGFTESQAKLVATILNAVENENVVADIIDALATVQGQRTEKTGK